MGIGARLLAGCTTGAMAVTFAQPTDVVKVRFQAQGRLTDSGGVKRYNSTLEAYRTIARDEGIKGLWKGKKKKNFEETNQYPKYILIVVLIGFNYPRKPCRSPGNSLLALCLQASSERTLLYVEHVCT